MNKIILRFIIVNQMTVFASRDKTSKNFLLNHEPPWLENMAYCFDSCNQKKLRKWLYLIKAIGKDKSEVRYAMPFKALLHVNMQTYINLNILRLTMNTIMQSYSRKVATNCQLVSNSLQVAAYTTEDIYVHLYGKYRITSFS